MKISSSSVRVTQHLRQVAAELGPGRRLPAVRALMREFSVSPGTVQAALDQLVAEGVIETHPGQGTFVAPPTHAPKQNSDLSWQSLALGAARPVSNAMDDFATLPPRDALVLNAGYLPEDLQPLQLLSKAAAQALRRPDVWARSPGEGVFALRSWFASETGLSYQPHEVLICPGTQSALATAFRALAAPGDPVLFESPTYAGALAAARAAGLIPVPVPTDAQGVRPDMLAEAFRTTGARLFYCQPCYANPTGSVLAPDRRDAVLQLVADHSAFLIEDDWARDFHLDAAEPPEPLARRDPAGHVVYVRSLTKSASPGMRVGAICARGAALARLRQARVIDDFFVPAILQETTLQLVTSRGWSQHLKALRRALRERRNLLAAALVAHLGPECLPQIPTGGLHLWLKLRAGCSDLDVARQANARGILVSRGTEWFPAEPPAPFLRLSFAAADPDRIEAGVANLAGIIAAVTSGQPPLHAISTAIRVP